MELSFTHRLKRRSALVKKNGVESATNSYFGNNKHVMFLKLRPELKKKNLYIYIYIYIFIHIYIYIHAQVIQNCTTLNRVDIYNEDGKQQDLMYKCYFLLHRVLK